MTIKLVALGDWRRTLVLVMLVAAAALMTATAAAPARAATKQTPVLAQGAGMSGKPSAAVRQRAARAAQPRLQPRPAGRRRALWPADRRGGAVVAVRPRAGRRRHRRTADPQGRASIERRAQRPSTHARQRPQLAHQAAGARRPPRRRKRPRPRRGQRRRRRCRMARTARRRAGRVLRRPGARAATHRPPAGESAAGHRAGRARALPRGPQHRGEHRALPRARVGHDGRSRARR